MADNRKLQVILKAN